MAMDQTKGLMSPTTRSLQGLQAAVMIKFGFVMAGIAAAVLLRILPLRAKLIDAGNALCGGNLNIVHRNDLVQRAIHAVHHVIVHCPCNTAFVYMQDACVEYICSTRAEYMQRSCSLASLCGPKPRQFRETSCRLYKRMSGHGSAPTWYHSSGSGLRMQSSLDTPMPIAVTVKSVTTSLHCVLPTLETV